MTIEKPFVQWINSPNTIFELNLSIVFPDYVSDRVNGLAQLHQGDISPKKIDVRATLTISIPYVN